MVSYCSRCHGNHTHTHKKGYIRATVWWWRGLYNTYVIDLLIITTFINQTWLESNLFWKKKQNKTKWCPLVLLEFTLYYSLDKFILSTNPTFPLNTPPNPPAPWSHHETDFLNYVHTYSPNHSLSTPSHHINFSFRPLFTIQPLYSHSWQTRQTLSEVKQNEY